MYLFGASGHGKVIADAILSNKNVAISAFIDDNPNTKTILEIPVLHSASIQLTSNDDCVLCIGNNKIRKNVAEKLKTNFTEVFHPKAVISNFSTIGKGTVVMAGAVVNPEVVIGKHCIINTNAVVEHDCFIEDYVHISPNAALAGNVVVGEGSHIGIGASVIQGIRIGKWATIGAGAVVINNVPNGAMVVGNPGRIIKIEGNHD
ncbi:acetyltransferase [Flavobacterium chuncheonense]|uniref:Acetyltransferase n=1 Tax=Flavobacterium chuncheonense TaxID=2026653 RepID=A0ABW5YJ42_9FLAO